MMEHYVCDSLIIAMLGVIAVIVVVVWVLTLIWASAMEKVKTSKEILTARRIYKPGIIFTLDGTEYHISRGIVLENKKRGVFGMVTKIECYTTNGEYKVVYSSDTKKWAQVL